MDKTELKKQWKLFLLDNDTNTSQVAKDMNQYKQSLSRKIREGTIKYLELAKIVEKYGYTIDIRKKDKAE